MVQDPLNKRQHIRIAALNAAVFAHSNLNIGPSGSVITAENYARKKRAILETAKEFGAYIENGETDA